VAHSPMGRRFRSRTSPRTSRPGFLDLDVEAALADPADLRAQPSPGRTMAPNPRQLSIIVANGLGGEQWQSPARSPARVRTSAQGAGRRGS
jgi:hypothetical protein